MFILRKCMLSFLRFQNRNTASNSECRKWAICSNTISSKPHSDFYLIFDSEVKLDEAAVLHYTYSKFSDLTSRRDRCGCKPTKDDVKRCFMLEFDRSVSLDI